MGRSTATGHHTTEQASNVAYMVYTDDAVKIWKSEWNQYLIK